VLGLLINLPTVTKNVENTTPNLEDATPAPTGIDTRLLERLWDTERNYQYKQVRIKPPEVIEGSYIEYFLNGESLGVAFMDLLLGTPFNKASTMLPYHSITGQT
jgi:hypothetical protein